MLSMAMKQCSTDSLVGLLARLTEQASSRVSSRSISPGIAAKALKPDPDGAGRTIGGPTLLAVGGSRI